MPTQLQALQAFADTMQNPDLLRLETLLSRFNLFEAIGVKTQELRHSDLLACLLDPSQQHGLGTTFLREFLRIVQTTVEDKSTLATLDLNALNMNGCYVIREGQRIDILVVDELNRLAVIIENKIDSGERDGQLNRYYDAVYDKYLGYSIVPIYLTRDGNAPTDDRYYTASYTQVCRVIEQIAQQHHSALEVDVVVLLEHYAQMLRRHIVSDSDVAELCRRIHKQHKQALEIIIKHIPNPQAQIAEYVQSLIQRTSILYLGATAKNWTTFGLNDWSAAPLITSAPYYVYLEFHHLPYELRIFCTLSPGNPNSPSNTECREKLFDMAKRHKFAGCETRLRRNHCRLSIIQVLRPDDYEKTQEEIEAQISEKWDVFLRDELPRMAQAIREEKWLWELP